MLVISTILPQKLAPKKRRNEKEGALLTSIGFAWYYTGMKKKVASTSYFSRFSLL